MSTQSGWEGILDDDEEVRWQGRPDGAVVWRAAHLATGLFGLVFAGFALFWMIIAAQAGGGMWAFGLIHFSAGISIAIAPPFWNAYKRRNSWYTLTNRRAIIATDMPMVGRKLKSYPITKSTMLELDSGALDSVIFASEYRHRKNGTYEIKIGFERIEDGRKIYGLIRDIQKEIA
ncbi:MAG: aspartate carbamoyltransferase catalytic subunit [Marinosulfonomonas sp.]|nr:aspartate carbamoyltransferase catalytic subunit [Marinosulfonomonas sp.]